MSPPASSNFGGSTACNKSSDYMELIKENASLKATVEALKVDALKLFEMVAREREEKVVLVSVWFLLHLP
jgi:hypothetical protein